MMFSSLVYMSKESVYLLLTSVEISGGSFGQHNAAVHSKINLHGSDAQLSRVCNVFIPKTDPRA